MIAAAAMGIPTRRFRRRSRCTTGGFAASAKRSYVVTFVSKARSKSPALAKLKLARPLPAVKNMRKLKKKDMVHNNWQPRIEVDAETYAVRADGALLECEPAQVLPMAQRYFLF